MEGCKYNSAHDVDVADWAAVLVWSAISAGLGAYFVAYLKKKAETRRIHEIIERLVAQVRATAAATEAIRVELAGGCGRRQSDGGRSPTCTSA